MDETTGKVGEKVEIKRIAYFNSNDGFFCEYNHLGNKMASLIEIQGKISDKGIELGNDLAMQVVAMKPLTIDRTSISPEQIAKEKRVPIKPQIFDVKSLLPFAYTIRYTATVILVFEFSWIVYL